MPPYSWDGPFRFETYGNVKRIRGEPVQAPWSLRIFGETGTTGIPLPGKMPGATRFRDRLVELFPEAQIFVYPNARPGELPQRP